MMSADAQAYLAIDFKAAAGSEESETRWTERVRGWQHDAPVVYATSIWRGLGWSSQSEVPFEEVGFEG